MFALIRDVLDELEGKREPGATKGFLWVFIGGAVVAGVVWMGMRWRATSAQHEAMMVQMMAQQSKEMKDAADRSAAEMAAVRKESEKQRAEIEKQRAESERRREETAGKLSEIDHLTALIEGLGRKQREAPPPPPPLKDEFQTVTVNGIKCEMISASRNGSRVILNMVVTSTQVDCKMWPPYAEGIDENGNPFASPRPGGMQNAATNVFAGVKTRCVLILQNVPLKTKVLSRVVVYGLHPAPEGFVPADKRLPATFVDVRIQ